MPRPPQLISKERCACGDEHVVVARIGSLPVIQCPLVQSSAVCVIPGASYLVMGTEDVGVSIRAKVEKRERDAAKMKAGALRIADAAKATASDLRSEGGT